MSTGEDAAGTKRSHLIRKNKPEERSSAQSLILALTGTGRESVCGWGLGGVGEGRYKGSEAFILSGAPSLLSHWNTETVPAKSSTVGR